MRLKERGGNDEKGMKDCKKDEIGKQSHKRNTERKETEMKKGQK
jgi:hypothetical protein